MTLRIGNRPARCILSVAGLFVLSAFQTVSAQQILPYGMVVQLRNDTNLPTSGVLRNATPNLTSEANKTFGMPRIFGGDIGEPRGKGFTWLMLEDDTTFDVSKLPPGIVFSLRHSLNQKDTDTSSRSAPGNVPYDWSYISVGGANPCNGDKPPRGLRGPFFGGDLGAPAKQGFYWYETDGSSFNGDWSIVDRLPKGIIIGLKNDAQQSQKDNTVKWGPDSPALDSRDLGKNTAPVGFSKMFGGDVGAPSGQGYFWFEKTSGDVAALPILTASISQSTQPENGKLIWGFKLKNQGGGTARTDFNVQIIISQPIRLVPKDGAEGAPLVPSDGPRTVFNYHVTAAQAIEPGKTLSIDPAVDMSTPREVGKYSTEIIVDSNNKIAQSPGGTTIFTSPLEIH